MTCSAIASAITQDLGQMLMVVVCVFAGWYLQIPVVEMFQRILMDQNANEKLKVIESTECCTMTYEDSDDDRATSALGGAKKEVLLGEDELDQGLLLLERYGVFGARPGAWTRCVVTEDSL
eukprot:TRINITY_DN66158_c0_g1_i1.p1 TRINITY_DN66158_c0_g1~~TRINITY_DN66158_c0_g1_i1.p1  ORF type:complete len:121 (+),score=27.53 TRINITY_DN66158_c0_g1_i1:168-530(+)